MYGFYTGGESRRAAFRISFVHAGRQYFLHALAPALSPIDRLPAVIGDILANGVDAQQASGDRTGYRRPASRRSATSAGSTSAERPAAE